LNVHTDVALLNVKNSPKALLPWIMLKFKNVDHGT
jgi:hypothetical protein